MGKAKTATVKLCFFKKNTLFIHNFYLYLTRFYRFNKKSREKNSDFLIYCVYYTYYI